MDSTAPASPVMSQQHFLHTLHAFHALKTSIDGLFIHLPEEYSANVSDIQEQIANFEKNFLFWNCDICQVKEQIDVIIKSLFSDAKLETLAHIFSELNDLFESYPNLIDDLFRWYLHDRVNQVVRFTTMQFVSFWNDYWNPKTKMTPKLQNVLQQLFDYNCHLLELICVTPCRLSKALTTESLKLLLESLLPYLVIYHSDSSTRSFANNMPIDLSCIESPYDSIIKNGLDYLTPSCIIIALLQLVKDFFIRSKFGPKPEAAFLLDLTQFGFIFTTYGYQFQAVEMEQLYLNTLEAMLNDFFIKWKLVAKDLCHQLHWTEILYELYLLFEVIHFEPKTLSHTSLTLLTCAFTNRLLKRAASGEKRNKIWSYFALIDADLATKGLVRENCKLFEYIFDRLERSKQKRAQKKSDQPVVVATSADEDEGNYSFPGFRSLIPVSLPTMCCKNKLKHFANTLCDMATTKRTIDRLIAGMEEEEKEKTDWITTQTFQRRSFRPVEEEGGDGLQQDHPTVNDN